MGSYDNVQTEFVAIVLAATVGSRLFPLTEYSSGGIPKHLLEVAGVPILQRLLHELDRCGFMECVVAIAHEDSQTLEFIQRELKRQQEQIDGTTDGQSEWREISSPSKAQNGAPQGSGSTSTSSTPGANSSSTPGGGDGGTPSDPTSVDSSQDSTIASICFQLEIAKRLKVTIVRLAEDCQGSVGAISQIEELEVITPKSHVVILPGDLVLLDGMQPPQQQQQPSVLMDLVHAHRRAQSCPTGAAAAACTLLLTDVGEQDENGAPLKESAKLKKGGFAREEDDIEYIAVSYPSNSVANETTPRIVWKQSKLEAEEDQDMTGASPKLQLAKPRLRLGDVTKVRTDWTDVHVYVLSPWLRRLIEVRNKLDDNKMEEKPLSLISLTDDLLPLLITRQFLSIQEAFGSKMESVAQVEELLKSLESTGDFGLFAPSSSPLLTRESSATTSSPTMHRLVDRNSPGSLSPPGAMSAQPPSSPAKAPFSVQAHIQKSAFRSSTISAYIYVTKEMVSRALSLPQQGNSTPLLSSKDLLMLPSNSSIRHKFQTIVLPGSTVGDKATFKSTVVGRHCTLGNKCRLNNVILLDNVTLGDNVSLQNTVIGRGAVLGDNCSLNDCQVAPGKTLPARTKAKNEALSDDDEDRAAKLGFV